MGETQTTSQTATTTTTSEGKPPQVTQAEVAKKVKPGWATSEFYMAWAAKIVGALLTSGILGDGTTAQRIAGLVAMVLAQGGYTWSRTMVKTSVPLILALLMMSNASACGPSARTKTIRASLVATNAAEVGFIKFDQTMQARLVEAATDRATGEASLHAWRVRRGEAEDVLVAAYRAIAIAATLDDDASLQGMLSALAILRQQLAAMGVTL